VATPTENLGYKKIMDHPDRDEIVQKLAAGDSTRIIEAWLKGKYPDSRKLQISYISLQFFRKNFLKIEADALKAIKEEKIKALVQRRQVVQEENVQKLQSYQIGLANYVQNNIIDYNSEIMGLIEDCKEGIRSLKELNGNKSSHLNHQAIATYINRLQDVMIMHQKFVNDQEKKAGNKMAEDYDILSRKMDILVEAVRESFNQTNPEGLPIFLQIVKEKMIEAGLTS